MIQKGDRLSKAHRDAISRGVRRALALKDEGAKLSPRDLGRLEKEGVIAPALAPIVAIGKAEGRELMVALGGEKEVSPQRRILIEDLVACGIGLRGVLQLFLQSHSAELASRIASLASARRQILSLLGLERFARQLDVTGGVEVSWSSDDEEGSGSAAKPRSGTVGVSSPLPPVPGSNPEGAK